MIGKNLSPYLNFKLKSWVVPSRVRVTIACLTVLFAPPRPPFPVAVQVPATSLRTNRVALFGSSARIHPAAELESATAPGPGTYSVVDALTKTRLQHAPVVSFAR
jgi:hypothetical protein